MFISLKTINRAHNGNIATSNLVETAYAPRICQARRIPVARPSPPKKYLHFKSSNYIMPSAP